MKNSVKKKIALAFVAVVAIGSAKVYIDYRNDIAEYNARIAELETKIDDQQQYKDELDSTEDIYSSQESVEQIARDTLGLVKSNEKFFKNYNDNE
ncbi:MAG: septum formation initiator family protein [Acutalibacteraceae bacterium]|nr:septum formation initiator family protein [Acutalibacteraceae bacterium]